MAVGKVNSTSNTESLAARHKKSNVLMFPVSGSNKRLPGKPETRQKLLDAIDRIKNSKTKVISPDREISILAVAEEAGVHVMSIHQTYKDISPLITQIRKNAVDIIYLKDLGLDSKGSVKIQRLNLSKIKQPWLKEFLNQFLRILAQTRSADTLLFYVAALNHFSKFLDKYYSQIAPEAINRKVGLDFLTYLKRSKLSNNYQFKIIIAVKLFFDMAVERKMLSLPHYPIFYKEDNPKYLKESPRFIPESVLTQLNNNLKSLNPYIRRMIIIIQECGMRIGELINLKFDCLIEDRSGDFFIKLYQSKMKKDHTIPVSKETVEVVKKQQKAIIAEWGKHMELLFPMPKFSFEDRRKLNRAGKPYLLINIMNHLNKISKKENILGPSGKVWHFQTHQFRHTVGTRMINNGVPQPIVQRFLGHESPQMTTTYAHIMDQTLKEEFAKFHGKMVDIHGKIYEPEGIIENLTKGINVNDVDAQWLKKNISIQALPNGVCTLPVIQGSCPHANACFTCSHFRTDYRYLSQHKRQLEKTIQIIKTAETNGWQRQLEMNIRLRDNLIAIIQPLEGKNDTQT